MPTFMIELSHTPQECQQTMENVAKDLTRLSKEAVWGCEAGSHTMWAQVEAESADQARSMLPFDLREQARVTPVQRMTGDELREWRSA
ncbi:MAG: hypothetical protein C4521_11140 [Actinobacteria bacterium]|nr:MAG: hypothetical protein C4521_11140 [Actinomycetota bacterium]